MKEMILEILESRFDYYRPDEDLLIAIIDFENEFKELTWDLNDIEKEVLTLYGRKYDTFQEIADEMGFSRQYINTVYHRAVNKIMNNYIS